MCHTWSSYEWKLHQIAIDSVAIFIHFAYATTSSNSRQFFQRRIWENFHQIRLRPENFPDLLINEIGFERYQTVGRPHHSAHGFSRQLQLFTKVGRRGPALPDREGG